MSRFDSDEGMWRTALVQKLKKERTEIESYSEFQTPDGTVITSILGLYVCPSWIPNN